MHLRSRFVLGGRRKEKRSRYYNCNVGGWIMCVGYCDGKSFDRQDE